jgi:hypothetical protein
MKNEEWPDKAIKSDIEPFRQLFVSNWPGKAGIAASGYLAECWQDLADEAGNGRTVRSAWPV